MNKLTLTLLGMFCLHTYIYTQQDYRDLTRSSYDKTAKEYHKNAAELPPAIKAQIFLDFLPPGSQILDIGCGYC